MCTISYCRHRFPPEIIQHAVWLYFRFPLSFRDVEDLLAERGIDVSYETVRRWALKFGLDYARKLRNLRPRPDAGWHLDELFVSINGKRMYLWRACVGSPLALRSAMRLIEMLRQIAPDELTPEKLMVLVQALPEQDDRYTPMGRENAESARAEEAARRFGQNISGRLQQRAPANSGYYAQCKRALILGDWTDGVTVELIEDRYTSNPFVPVRHGDIRGLADATRFYMASAARIASIVYGGAGPTEEEIGLQLKRLDLGLPGDSLWLTDLGVGLARGEYLALHDVGVRTADEIKELSEAQLEALVGAARAKEIRLSLQTINEAA